MYYYRFENDCFIQLYQINLENYQQVKAKIEKRNGLCVYIFVLSKDRPLTPTNGHVSSLS